MLVLRLMKSCYARPVLGLLLAVLAWAQPAATLSGVLTDPQGRAISGASLHLLRRSNSARSEATSADNGRFLFADLPPGDYRLTAEARGFPPLTRSVRLTPAANTADLHFSALATQNQSVIVTADVSDAGVFSPDPAQRVMVREETLDANPGRPGMPISLPGLPVESPAGGIKPPQYFAPGVAGDHGEPIGMFFQIGGFLFPNNLPANAHGNGYADPNVIIPLAIETVQTDGGAFNVREGNNSINAAITLGLRDRIEPTLRLSADSRDLNLVAAWSPPNPANKSWIGLEIGYGNGFLARLEHRKQYKANVSKVFTFGRHALTAYGAGYYGFAYQPGLIPIDARVPGDSIDSRQREETSNGTFILNDIWRPTPHSEFQFSAAYRYYTLDVRPNFGDGWIRQSEHRNVNLEDALYSHTFTRAFSLLAGFDARREAPRALDLDRADAAGLFQPVTANNVTINFNSPYAAADGLLLGFLHYNLGLRRDRVTLENRDLYRPAFSFHRAATVNSPKATVSLIPPSRLAPILPIVSLSYGQAFHVEDPRIGVTALPGGTLVAKARSFQLAATKTFAQTEFKVTLAHVTTAQQLARISNDTGLQEDVGPGIVKSIALTARRNFSRGFLQALFARADARDRLTGEPTPEAPRLIWGLLGTLDRLPFHLAARAESEAVGRKPRGDLASLKLCQRPRSRHFRKHTHTCCLVGTACQLCS